MNRTTMRLLGSMAGSLSSFWRRGAPVQRAGYVVSALLLISGLMHLAMLVIAGGSWEGPLSFRKPATFGLSFGLTLTTIVWVASFLRLGDRARTVLLETFTVACVIETALVSLQAWRRVPSHFNIDTTFDALVARTLAAGGLALIVTVAGLSITAFRPYPRYRPASGSPFKSASSRCSGLSWSEHRELALLASGMLTLAGVAGSPTTDGIRHS
jgi:hypothetical protein